MKTHLGNGVFIIRCATSVAQADHNERSCVNKLISKIVFPLLFFNCRIKLKGVNHGFVFKVEIQSRAGRAALVYVVFRYRVAHVNFDNVGGAWSLQRCFRFLEHCMHLVSSVWMVHFCPFCVFWSCNTHLWACLMSLLRFWARGFVIVFVWFCGFVWITLDDFWKCFLTDWIDLMSQTMTHRYSYVSTCFCDKRDLAQTDWLVHLFPCFHLLFW